MTSAMAFDARAAQRVESIYITPDVVWTRTAVFRALDPRSGERIADLGCGPGFMTEDLARAVGEHGRVFGVDLSEPMLAIAGRRCAELSSVTVTRGDMTALELPDESLDGVVAMQSLAYVPEVGRAMAEIARVLRPGGRAAVLDTDFDSLVWHGQDQARVNRILAAYDAHVAHPGLPRVLSTIARGAGLSTLRREVVPILDASFHAHTYAHGIAAFIRDFVVGSGRISEEETNEWLRECAELDESGAFFMSLNRYLFILGKPARVTPQPRAVVMPRPHRPVGEQVSRAPEQTGSGAGRSQGLRAPTNRSVGDSAGTIRPQIVSDNRAKARSKPGLRGAYGLEGDRRGHCPISEKGPQTARADRGARSVPGNRW